MLARAGLGSRRDMEALILEGRVAVNGAVASVGLRVSESDRVMVDGKPVRIRAEAATARVLLYHKPAGEMVTANDPEGRPTVFASLPRLQGRQWLAIGRLDFNTSGVLLFTDSGELANRLMHPSSNLEREYAVRVMGELTREQQKALKEGVVLEDGPAHFDDIKYQGGEGANRWYNVLLQEGRNREVRRMFESAGLIVSRLIRTRFGPVTLPPRLARGRWQMLDAAEMERLLAALGG